MAKYYLDDTGVQALVGETKEYVSGAVSEHANDSTAHLTSTEKTKLGNIEDGANKTITDSSLSSSSTNPVQNKVVNSALSGKVPTTRTVNGKALSANISLSASDVGADASGTANTAVSNHNTSTSAHNDIRELITGLTTRLNTLADSDDTTLDQMSEVVADIKANKELIESITTSKVNVSDIVNNLTTNVSTKPLSAAQGVAIKALIDALQTEVDAKALASDLTSHTGNTSNPHSVTKSQVGLGNVENVSVNNHAPTYSDTTTLTTLTSGEKLSAAFPKIKLAITNLISHLANTSNPHGVTKSQVGLGNVENKSSATIRGELTKANVTTALGYTPPETDTSYGEASTTAAGLMSASDKEKLDGIATGATKVTVDSALSSSSTNPVQNKVINSALAGKAATSHGNHVPTTETANNAKFLRNDNTWATVTPANIGAAASGHTHSSYANQNAFSNVAVGDVTVAADTTTDTLTLAGSNVTLTPDATNDKVTIGITKENVVSALGYTPSATNTTYGVATSSALGLVKSGTDITVDSSGNVSVNDDSHNHTIANVDGLQTALDAKAASSHGTHVTYSTTAPAAAGTASAGTATTVSRSDHVHPAQTTVSGNAGSATKVNNSLAIKLNGGSTEGTNLFTFNGSAAKTVDITPSAIGAAASSHGTHVSYGTSAAALGTSSAGSASTVSRSDHVHALPALTSCTGTLTVAKGGTGATTLASGQVLVGNGTGAVTTKAIDTTAGGTSGSANLITSGAVYSGLSNMISDDVTADDIAAIVV